MKYYTPTKLSENISETPEGFLVCIGVPIARTGEMEYGEHETPLEADEKGKVIISRSEEEVFRPETIASFEGKPVTITHPVDFVTPENWSRLAKGTLQNVRRGEGDQKNDLLADLLITDSVAINLVKNGLREVSCGYEAEYVQTEEGRGIQTNIVGNHLALVDEGRAGSSYAINDHKGENKMKLGERIKAIFAKAKGKALTLDEAMNLAKDEEGEKEEAKDWKDAYDELVKMCDAMKAQIDSMGKGKDAEGEAAGGQGERTQKEGDEKEEKEKEEKTGDEPASLEDRLKALETAVAKLLEGKSEDEEMEDDGEEEESEDEEMEDDDHEESGMTGDTKSRAEILAPGIKATKDVKVQALKAAYATKDGKRVIDSLTGGKKPAFDQADKVDTLFIAASELLKVERSQEMVKTKTHDYQSVIGNDGPMTAEKMNEINAQFYKRN